MVALVSIVELPSFIREVHGELSEEELDQLKNFLAADPEAGVLIKNTGGVRKLRWAASGRGKRGGGRVIYYFHSEAMPLFLISFFKKAAKSDLSATERAAARTLVEALVDHYKPD